ncbi:hypothetical protein CSW60_18500 [Caulobacter sp. X]|nr:hypothetical protein CSW60_18500 [Caulobacter sp. X]
MISELRAVEPGSERGIAQFWQHANGYADARFCAHFNPTRVSELLEENERLRKEAEGRARADANYRARWKRDDLFRSLDEIRRRFAGLRPGDAEELAELQSRCLIAETEREAAEDRAARAEEAMREAADELKIAARQNELSANIMRDPARTGGWVGAERTAAAFDRHGLKVAAIRAKLMRAMSKAFA